jgi:hypothetical protein
VKEKDLTDNPERKNVVGCTDVKKRRHSWHEIRKEICYGKKKRLQTFCPLEGVRWK